MFIHDRLGFVVLILAAGGAIASIVSLFRPQILATVRVYLILASGVVALQVVVGLVLVLTGSRPAALIHWFYGGATLAALPLCAWIGRTRPEGTERLWLAGGAVATFLFAVRALTTG
jgi:heme A synthase